MSAPSLLRRPGLLAPLCALLLATLTSGCATPPSRWKLGVQSPVDDPQHVNALAQVQGRRVAESVPVVPTAHLRGGLSGFDLGVGTQITLDHPLPGLGAGRRPALFATFGVDIFTLGRSRDFWYASTFGPSGEVGVRLWQDDERARWWTISVIVDHDMRIGPRHRTFAGVLIGWTPAP